jgi:hypothetical protein
MPDVPSPIQPTLAPSVKALLGLLRRRIRQYIWLEGCAAAVACLGAAFWGTLAADWFFEPSVPVRVAMLAAVAAALTAVIVRWIGRRAFVPITDSNVATLLERRFPQFNDSLLTAVTLADRLAAAGTAARNSPLLPGEGQGVRAAIAGNLAICPHPNPLPEGEGTSVEPVADADLNLDMLARTCREAESHLAEVDVPAVFNPRPLWLHGTAATALVITVAIFVVLFPVEFGVWARRALGMSHDLWPRSTHLEVLGFDDGVRKAARGADLEVVVRADMRWPRVPKSVEVRPRTGGSRATMDRRGVVRVDGVPFQEYAYTFRAILADVRFDVVGGDDRVSNLRIQAVESPTVSRMTLECQLPAYTRRRRLVLPVSGVMQVPMGSRVTVRAAEANKDLVGVQLTSIVGDRPGPAQTLAERSLTADRRGFSCSLPPLVADTTLLLTLLDADGIKNREPIRLILVPTPDEPPQMAVRLDGIGTAITPKAHVAVAGQITDDYGIARVWFEWTIDQQDPRCHPIADLPEAPGVFSLAGAALDVSGLALRPGQKMLLCVKAADLCDLGRGPNVSTSERWMLDVVTPERFRAMLEARELVLRQRFEQLLQEATETRDLLARLNLEDKPAKKPDKPKKPEQSKRGARNVSPLPLGEGPGVRADADARDALTLALSQGERGQGVAEPGDTEPADSPARQRDVRFGLVQGALTNCSKGGPEVLGVAEAFEDIYKQYVNNRIDNAESSKRLMQGIAEPLRRVAGAMFPELDRRLADLQTTLDDRRRAAPLRDRAEQQAESIVVAMRTVRDRMLESEDFNEAVELLQDIIDAQKRLHDSTQQRHKQKIRDLLKE